MLRKQILPQKPIPNVRALTPPRLIYHTGKSPPRSAGATSRARPLRAPEAPGTSPPAEPSRDADRLGGAGSAWLPRRGSGPRRKETLRRRLPWGARLGEGSWGPLGVPLRGGERDWTGWPVKPQRSLLRSLSCLCGVGGAVPKTDNVRAVRSWGKGAGPLYLCGAGPQIRLSWEGV